MIYPSVYSSLNSVSSLTMVRLYFSFRLLSRTSAWATVLLVTFSISPVSSPALTQTSMTRLSSLTCRSSVGFCRMITPSG